MPITVPQINPTLLQGAAPSGLSNLLPGYLAGTKLAQQRQVAESQTRASEATYQETLRNAANLARKRQRQDDYEVEVSALDITAADYRTKLFDIQTRYPDVVTSPQTALLPEDTTPTPVTDPEKIKIAKFLAPDDVAEQQKIVRSLIEDPEATEKVTNAMLEAAEIYPYPAAATAEQTETVDKQRRDYLLKRTLKEEGDIVIKMPPGPKAGEEALYKWFVDEERGWMEEARQAQKDLIASHQILRILQKSGIRTGALAGFTLGIKKLAIAMWPSLKETWGEGIAEAEAVTAFGNRLALALKKEMPGPLSDKDVRFMQESSPGLERTPEGNLILLSLLIRRQERSIVWGRMITEYAKQSESGFVDRGVDEWVNEQPAWQPYRVIMQDDGTTTGGLTTGYKAGRIITDILQTIDANDGQATQKLDGLPNYTVYYLLGSDGKKRIKMKMPGTATPAATTAEPTTALPFETAIKNWIRDGMDPLRQLEIMLENAEAGATFPDPRKVQRAMELYKAGKY
jgi:hypothetical protein